MIRYRAPGIRAMQSDAALGVGAWAVPVVLAIDLCHHGRVGRQFGLILFVPAEYRRAGGRDELEVGWIIRDWLAVGADEPRLGLAAGLEMDGQVFAGLLAGEFDRRAPLLLGVEDNDARGRLRRRARAPRTGRRGPGSGNHRASVGKTARCEAS